MMVRTEAFDQANGFDEAFNPVQFEDFDLCYRIREAGGKVVYTPTVEVYHYESVTTQGTATLSNPALVIRHGLLFKKRWRHMFAAEDGPLDSETEWKDIELPAFDEIRSPEIQQ